MIKLLQKLNKFWSFRIPGQLDGCLHPVHNKPRPVLQVEWSSRCFQIDIQNTTNEETDPNIEGRLLTVIAFDFIKLKYLGQGARIWVETWKTWRVALKRNYMKMAMELAGLLLLLLFLLSSLTIFLIDSVNRVPVGQTAELACEVTWRENTIHDNPFLFQKIKGW